VDLKKLFQCQKDETVVTKGELGDKKLGDKKGSLGTVGLGNRENADKGRFQRESQ